MKEINFLIQNEIDVNRGIELLGDIETYNEMLEEFLIEIESKLNNLKINKESKDMSNYAIYAHSLKSDSKYFGFTKLIDLAFNHEMESKNNNIAYIESNYEQLINETYRVIDIVKEYLGK